ncbi:hypothetical protein Q4Q34_13170 [Flavivirga abyssicola]|uniref:hypothetical protein n=1 Tax=Flavivirga abyssicola TaxID=3063533 RepID=UPI0026DF2660|nr:hypothetical protein [Flavivirga sp. MEBiC07777]WVK12170.1 hypothetical protein Q4Q34_13170 [Flavivirga sp. MEBiC07777]
MEINKKIQDKINDTFESMDAIETVKVSPFFKDKTMKRLFAEKEEEQLIWSWFSPKLQLATLVCFIVLNVLAFTQLNSNEHDSDINDFAETYGLSSGSGTSLFN